MTTHTEYFEQKAYHPTYHLGDRVFGRHQNVPFVGTVGVDHIVVEEQGPRVVVLLDLPLKVNDSFVKHLIVTHGEIKPLKTFT